MKRLGSGKGTSWGRVRSAAVIACLSAAAIPASASADVIIVSTTADEFGPNPTCSLREAVETANGDADFGGCAQTGSSSGPDTITVPAGTYTLTGAPLDDVNASGDLDVRAAGLADEGG